MGREVIDDDDVAAPECWRQTLVDIGKEGSTGYWPIHYEGGGHLVMAKPGYEGDCLPMPLRHAADQPLAAPASAAKPHLVEVEVSSMNTNRAGSNMPCSRIQRRRARATSGRSCSAACRLFFKADAVTVEQSPDRTAAAGDPSLAHRADDLIQRQIRMLNNQHQQPVGMLLQRRDTAPDRLRRDTAGFLPTLYPFDRRTGAHLKPFGRFAPRRTCFDRFKHTFAQVLRTSFRHVPAPKIESLPLDSRIYAFLGIPPIQLSRNML